MLFKKKAYFLIAFLLVVPALSYAAYTPGTWQEQDGNPKISYVKKLRLPNGTVFEEVSGVRVSIPTREALDFFHFEDAMDLDATTIITADGSEELSIINTGTGNSFVVNDQAADTTPFVIDPSGNVSIGTTTVTDLLTVEGISGLREQTSSPLSPIANYGRIFTLSSGSTNFLYFQDDSGSDTNISTIYGVRKVNNENVTNSSALQSDNELLISLVANTTYLVEGGIFASSTSGVPDITIGFTKPATATMSISYIAGQGGAFRKGGVMEVSDLATGEIGIDATTTVVIRLTGTITMGASSGTLQFRWAQANANATSTTVKQGSYLKVFDVTP